MSMSKISERLLRKEDGSVLVEYSIIVMLLLATTFAVIDIGYALWQWNGAEKATQLAARLAVVSSPVATGLEKYDCSTTTNSAGDPCTSAGFGTVICEGATPACTGGYVFFGAEANRILAKVQLVYPRVQLANLVFEYEDLELAFAGRGSPVAAVTMRLVGMEFEFLFLGAFISTGPFAMPDFRATLSTEDLSTPG